MLQAERLSLKLENELILATVSLNRLTNERINEILESSLDWSLLLNTSIRHGVFPFCCKTLMALSEKKIPSEENKRWKELYQANIQNNIRLTWKLVKCIELLSSNGIECFVLRSSIRSSSVR